MKESRFIPKIMVHKKLFLSEWSNQKLNSLFLIKLNLIPYPLSPSFFYSLRENLLRVVFMLVVM